MKLTAKFFTRFAVISALLLIVWGCAGSKSSEADPYAGEETTSADDYDEIEQLLGITSEDRQAGQDSGGDDDLLQLLQSNESDSQTAPPVNKTGAAAGDAQAMTLEQEVDDLNKKLKEKNKTISILRAQVMAMEEKVASAGGSVPGSNIVVSGQPGMSDLEYERQYQDGMRLAESRQFRDAIRVFEGMLTSRSNHSLSDNAQYWIGECYFSLGDYRAAILAFEKVFTYKRSNKNDYAQYKLGLCYFQLNERERAREEFQSLLDNYQDANANLLSKAEEYMLKL